MPLFSLLSLNSFGIPFYLGYSRIKRLASELNQLAPDVICLQEIQQNAYLPLLEKSLTTHPHLAFYYNQLAPKGGLFTASSATHPIVKSEFFSFPNQGSPFSIGFADWALNKGALVTHLEMQDRRFVVMNTHLQANYLSDWRIKNKQTQIQLDQVKYLVELVHAQPKDAWVIVCGDFNFPRKTPPYEKMVSHSTLTDALTHDPRPTYVSFPVPGLPGKVKMQTTLDYIFYKNPKGDNQEVTADIFAVEHSEGERPLQRFISDHHALTLNIG